MICALRVRRRLHRGACTATATSSCTDGDLVRIERHQGGGESCSSSQQRSSTNISTVPAGFEKGRRRPCPPTDADPEVADRPWMSSTALALIDRDCSTAARGGGSEAGDGTGERDESAARSSDSSRQRIPPTGRRRLHFSQMHRQAHRPLHERHHPGPCSAWPATWRGDAAFAGISGCRASLHPPRAPRCIGSSAPPADCGVRRRRSMRVHTLSYLCWSQLSNIFPLQS